MGDPGARIERLASLFGPELEDRTRLLHELILELEQGAGAHALTSMRRELHSLKSAARAVGASAIEQVAHAAEGAVHGLIDTGAHTPRAAWIDAVTAAVDLFGTLQREPRTDTSEVIGNLVAVTPETGRDAPSPTRPPEPVQHVRPSVVEASPQPRPLSEVEGVKKVEQNSVRVSLGKLDTLLTESGELSVTHLRVAQRLRELRELQREIERMQRDWTRTRPARSRLRRSQAHAGARDTELLLRMTERTDDTVQSLLQHTRELVGSLAQNTSQLAAVAGAIGEEVMAIRLLPAASVFAPLERLVRDLARQTGKEARLLVSGGDTEVDRRILDELRDPLMHMVRNMIDHGIELPQERHRAGKPVQGTVRLGAAQRGDRVHITVEDDGRGLDLERVRQTAIERNLVSTDRAEQLDEAGLIDLIFHPGFSTRAKVTEISGRGVGMDVVREHVTRLGGEIRVRTTPGSGTCFTISVPLTLATTRVLLVEDGGQLFAIPSSNIERTGRVRLFDIHHLEGRRALQIDGRPVPTVELGEILQHKRSEAADPQPEDWRQFFVLPNGDRSVAVMADRLIDETELVVKGLGAPLTRVRHVSGAAVLGTGAVVVILNPSDLIKSAHGRLDTAPRTSAHDVPAHHVERPKKRVLVVDDSVMTRTLERTILESAGYLVMVAGDGEQALEMLSAEDVAVDAIISDVEMPRMTGLELTAAVRQEERWRHLPIVLVTSLDSPEHIERGAAAGADAYIVKGRFDQGDLLQAIGRLV
jgi:two-component system chemotaxis sensor kinase CheA